MHVNTWRGSTAWICIVFAKQNQFKLGVIVFISSSLHEENTSKKNSILIPDLDDRVHYKFYFEQVLLHVVDLQLEKCFVLWQECFYASWGAI